MSLPCSIEALTLSAVTTRGLEMTLPRPSSSRADTSRFSTLETALLNSVRPMLPGWKPFSEPAGRFTKFGLVIWNPLIHITDSPVGQVVVPGGSGEKDDPAPLLTQVCGPKCAIPRRAPM